MVDEQVAGIVTDIDEDGRATIRATVPDFSRAALRQYKACWVVFSDGRRITPQQRGKIYALLGEIDEYVNGIRSEAGREEQKQFFKLDFMLHRMTDAERKMFSLSDCSVTTARAFITYLIEFIIANDIPTAFPLYEQADDIERYVYACLLHKKCAICGRPCDLHHAEGSRIGLGGNRETAHHLGRYAVPLCREHHTLLHAAAESEADFLGRYHLVPVKIDAAICKAYGLKK